MALATHATPRRIFTGTTRVPDMMEKKAKKDKAATGVLIPHILGEARKSGSLGAPGLEDSPLEISAASLSSAMSYRHSTHVVADSSSAGCSDAGANFTVRRTLHSIHRHTSSTGFVFSLLLTYLSFTGDTGDLGDANVVVLFGLVISKTEPGQKRT